MTSQLLLRSSVGRPGPLALLAGSRRPMSAAQPAAATRAPGVPALPVGPLQSSSLPSGVRVVSVQSPSPLAHVAVAVRSGCRHETVDHGGAVSQTLRLAAQLSNGSASQFMTTVRVQQQGAALECSGDREALVYSTAVLRSEARLHEVLPLLAGAATEPLMHPWELGALRPLVLADSERRSPLAALSDDLHLAAFRNSPLGRPLYADSHRLESVDSEALQQHVHRCVSGSRTQVVGVGVDHELLCDFAEQLNFQSRAGEPLPADQPLSVSGGEVRHDYGGPISFVAVAGEGVPAGSGAQPADRAAQLVLETLLGVTPSIKYGRATGLLSSVGCEHGAQVRALGAVYRDAALSGYCVVAPARDAGRVVKAVHAALKGTRFDEEQLRRGQQLARAAVLESSGSAGRLLESLVEQAVGGAALADTKHMLDAIDAVTLPLLKTAQQRVFGGKLAMAARGNLATVPYLDQL